MEIYGENIWDISSWTSDIHFKDFHLHRHFDSLPFLDCIREIIDLAQTYFQSVYAEYDDEEEEEGVQFDFPYLDIIVLLTEEFVYGHYFHGVTPLQELQLLEILCSYFQENKLDPVRYFVFDCLFGVPNEVSDLQKGLMDHKMNVICKLTSMAVGTGCGNVLNCIAVWLNTYGSYHSRAAKVAYYVTNDYCFICRQAIDAVKGLINVSPVFANQFVKAVYECYKDSDVVKDGSKIPPNEVVGIVASWIIDQPNFFSVKIPPIFLQLPSIHKYLPLSNQSVFAMCPLLVTFEWCLLEPLVRKVSVTDDEDTSMYWKLHYSFLYYLALQKKVDLLPVESSDDLEPGELLEESDSVELISKRDLMHLIEMLKKSLEEYKVVSLTRREESVNRFMQMIQVSKWAGCSSLKHLRPLLGGLVETRLLKQVLSCW